MKAILLLALLMTTVLSIQYSKDGNNVLILNEENFDEAIKEFPYLFVKFYAQHCAYCKKLAPEFSKAAESLSKARIQFGQVDGGAQLNLEKRFDIKGYPTMLFFINGNEMDYKGKRNESDIVAFINKHTATSVKVLKTDEEIVKFKSESRVAAIYFGEDKEELFNYEAASLNFDSIQFASCPNKNLAAKYITKGKIVIWKSFDANTQFYDNAVITRLELIEFFKKHATPLVMSLDNSTVDMLLTKKLPALVMFLDKATDQGKEVEKLITSVAKIIQGKIQVIVADIKDKASKELSDYVGVTEKAIPALRIIDTRKELKKYLFTESMIEKHILDFVKLWESNGLIPYIKSEPIPVTQPSPVVKIVGNTFKETIEKNADVLVKYYMPWDENCKKMAPIYEQLAKKMKPNAKLVIGDINIDDNETPGAQISQLPTIHLWAAGKKKKPIEYKGSFTLEAFENFLEEEMTYPFERIQTKRDDL